MKYKIIILILFFLSDFLFCNEDFGIKTYKLEDFYSSEKRILKIGILSFYDLDKANKDNIYSNSISDIWLSMYNPITKHKFSAHELDVVKKYVYQEAVDKIKDEINKIIEKKDKILFSNSYDYQKYSERKKIQSKELKEKRKELKFLLKQDYKNIKVEDEWDIEYSKELIDYKFIVDDDETFFIEEVKKIAVEKQIDILIYGFIKKIDNYRRVETYLYNNFEKKVIKEVQFTSQMANITDVAYKFGKEYIYYIMGRQWSSIKINSNVPDAKIYLNNKLKGRGDYFEDFLPSQIAYIKVSRQGYKDYEGSILIGKEEQTLLDVVLEKDKKVEYTVNTTPQGANVYLDSVWLGYSPVTFDNKIDAYSILIKSPGYMDQVYSLDKLFNPKKENKSANIPINVAFIDYQNNFRKSQIYFRTSIILFATSLVIPILFHGLYKNVNNAILSDSKKMNDKDYDKNFRLNNTYLWIRNGGFILSAFLFINLTVSITDYIKSSEKLFTYKN